MYAPDGIGNDYVVRCYPRLYILLARRCVAEIGRNVHFTAETRLAPVVQSCYQAKPVFVGIGLCRHGYVFLFLASFSIDTCGKDILRSLQCY